MKPLTHSLSFTDLIACLLCLSWCLADDVLYDVLHPHAVEVERITNSVVVAGVSNSLVSTQYTQLFQLPQVEGANSLLILEQRAGEWFVLGQSTNYPAGATYRLRSYHSVSNAIGIQRKVGALPVSGLYLE